MVGSFFGLGLMHISRPGEWAGARSALIRGQGELTNAAQGIAESFKFVLCPSESRMHAFMLALGMADSFSALHSASSRSIATPHFRRRSFSWN